MKNALVSVVMMAVVGALVVVAAMLTPMLQDDQAQVNNQIREPVERAQRLLALVNPAQERLATVLDAMRQEGVADPSASDLGSLIEQDPQLQEAMQAADEWLSPMLNDWSQEQRRLDEEFKAAGGTPTEVPTGRLGRNTAEMTRSLKEGLAARKPLLGEIDQLLKQADAAVREAKSVQYGTASGATHPDVLHMEGEVNYARATLATLQAAYLRHQARQERAKVSAAAAELARRAREDDIVR